MKVSEMLCQGGATLYGLPLPCKKSESFKEKDSNDLGNKLAFMGSFFWIIIFAPWYIAMFIIWVRLVINAFKCSNMEGASAIFFYPLYKIWKLGSLIEANCKSGSIF